MCSGWASSATAARGSGPALGVPASVAPGSPATLVWPHEVAGYLRLTFATVAPGTLVHVAFSETAEYLGVAGTSDWSRSYVTDDLEPTTGATWLDRPGCVSPDVCADGYRAFRFVRISVERGSARIGAADVAPVTAPARPEGSFVSSDHQLTRLWATAARTAQLMELPADPAVLGAACVVPGGSDLVVVVDGAKRDRCPWIGDLTVSGLSLFLAEGAAGTAPVVNTLALFAAAQAADGYLPASPMATQTVFDYPAYWVLAVDDLMLYRGELREVGALWPAVVAVLDGWYATYASAGGLLSDPFAPGDYAYIGRSGSVVAYYNALYARALEAGTQLAGALGHPDAATRWRARITAVRESFGATFWDAAAGAFLDAPDGPVVHPQDGNAFAILAGLATSSQAVSALRYLDRSTRLRYGNALADTNGWSAAPCKGEARACVFPFISYFDVEARFAAGADATALDELRRTWGWMPGSDWEAIGAGGTVDGYEAAASSLAAGWSTGVLPALTNDVLGVRPTGPGFSTFDAIPHPVGLAWAQGTVPTPAGRIRFGFRRIAHGYVLRLDAPSSLAARVGAPVDSPRVLVDGHAAVPAPDGTVTVHGSHVIELLGRVTPS